MPVSFFHEWWIRFYLVILRPMLKWVLRSVTGKCELLRITYEEVDKAKRAQRIESSLLSSRHPQLRCLATDADYELQEAVDAVLAAKGVLPEVHAGFSSSIKDSLQRIRAFNAVLKHMESVRSEKYDKDNAGHEDLLLQLWSLYMSGAPLPGRRGPHWGQLGFQGEDPATDFRGMGVLGLRQLIYFVESYPAPAKQVLQQSHHPKFGFSLAIVAINLTSLCVELMNKRHLRTHMYSLERPESSLEDLHMVYCYLLYEFSQFWLKEEPKDIMEFSRLRSKFRKQVKAKLRGDDPLLKSEFMDRS